MLALDLDMIEPVRRREALDLGALGVGGAVGAVVLLEKIELAQRHRVPEPGGIATERPYATLLFSCSSSSS
jgi:hypothetical protein